MAATARFTGVALFDKRHLVQNLARVAEEFLARGGERETFSRAEKEGDAEPSVRTMRGLPGNSIPTRRSCFATLRRPITESTSTSMQRAAGTSSSMTAPGA